MTSKTEKVNQYRGRVLWANRLLNMIKPEGPLLGVEVGLWKADFAVGMLKSNNRLSWIAVDPYSPYGKKKRTQPEWDDIHRRVMGKMSPFGDRFKLIRKISRDAVHDIPDDVDFVFIDGNHDLDVAYNDILEYEKKVRPGGILSGHDYIQRIKKAVDRYAEEFDRALQIDTGFDRFGVFWWEVK